MDAAILMLVNRPSTVANVVAFLILATAERGPVRALAWLVTGSTIAWLSEASSIRTGFPYGMYFYHSEQFAGEASLGGVPIFASLSISALAYFGYSAAWTLLSPLRGSGAEITRAADASLPYSGRVLFLGALVVMWVDVAMDPLTLLGRHWLLGDLYHYEANGFHFGVPLSNYAGWFLTAAAILFVNQRIGRALEGSVPVRPVALPYGPLLGVASQMGTYVYMTGAATYLVLASHVPDEIPTGGILISTIVTLAAYLALVAVMVRRGSVDLPQGYRSSAPRAARTREY